MTHDANQTGLKKPAKTMPGTHCWNRTTVPERGQGSTPDDRAGDSQGLTRTPTASFQGVRARETQPCRCLADVDLRRSKICLWLAGPICL